MKKFYKVIKTNFLWEKGAILTNDADDGKGYSPVSDIWNVIEDSGRDEYISDVFIEKNPEWFERVYSVNLLTKTVYKTKEEAKTLLNKEYKE